MVQVRKGWKRSLKEGAGAAAERSVGKIALLGDILFATTFTPGNALDHDPGRSRLYCLNYKIGMPATGTASCSKSSTGGYGNDHTKGVVDLGPGLATSPVLQLNKVNDPELSILTPTSLGIINRSSAGLSQTVRSGEIDWREIR